MVMTIQVSFPSGAFQTGHTQPFSSQAASFGSEKALDLTPFGGEQQRWLVLLVSDVEIYQRK
jgi:hypothetical protein